MTILCYRTGQIKALRNFASSQLGSEKVALMRDQEIEEWAIKTYVVLWGNYKTYDDDYKGDPEVFYLVDKVFFEQHKTEFVKISR